MDRGNLDMEGGMEEGMTEEGDWRLSRRTEEEGFK